MILFALLVGASLAFLLPLRRRPNFFRRLALCLGVILLPLLALGWNLGNTAPYFLASSLMSLLWGVATVRYCVELDWTASAYCSIWILLTAEVLYELWQFLLSLLAGAGGGRWPMACPWKKPCRNGRPSISCLNSIASDQRA